MSIIYIQSGVTLTSLTTGGALSLSSALVLPSNVSGQGYLYADSASSLYWVNGSGTSSLLV